MPGTVIRALQNVGILIVIVIPMLYLRKLRHGEDE